MYFVYVVKALTGKGQSPRVGRRALPVGVKLKLTGCTTGKITRAAWKNKSRGTIRSVVKFHGACAERQAMQLNQWMNNFFDSHVVRIQVNVTLCDQTVQRRVVELAENRYAMD